MRKLLTIILTVFVMFTSSFSINAEINNEQPFISYSLDYSTVANEDFKDYITSIQAVQDGSGYQIQVGENGEKYVAGYISGNSGTVTFTPHNMNLTGNVVISVDIDNRTASVNYTTTRITEYYHTATVRIYPSPLSEDTTMWCDIYLDGSLQDTRKANPTGNEFHFGSFSHTYSPDAVLEIDDISINSSGYAVVESTQIEGGVITKYMGDGLRELEIFMETHIPAQELELDYLRLLTHLNWESAKQEIAHYSNAQINQALASSSITLKNNGTGLTTNERLVTTITYWERLNNGAIIGDGIYNTQVAPRQIQVICQYYDTATEDCSSVKSLPRYYAVIADTYDYGTVERKPDTLYRNEKIWESDGEGLSFPTRPRNENLKYQYQYQRAYSYDSGWLSKDDYNREKNDNANFYKATNEQTRDGTRYTYRSYSSWTNWFPKTEAPYWYAYYGTWNYEAQDGSRLYKYKYETKNTTITDWVSATPGSGAYPYTSYDYKTQWACAYYQYSNYVDSVNSKTGPYQSQCALRAGYQQDQSSVCGYRTITTYKCPTSRTENTCTITSANACGYKYCQTSGCGVDYYVYNSCRNSACGKDYDVYKSCPNSQCGVASYKSCKHSDCGVDQYKSCRNSACGCQTYKADAKKCGKNIFGFAKRCAAAGCETYKSCRAEGCGVESYKSCRTQACGVESYKSCQVYACGVDHTVYKSCQTLACGIKSTVYRYCTNSECGADTCTVTSGSSCGYSFTWGSKQASAYGSYQTNCQVKNNDTLEGYYNSCAVYTCPQTKTLSSYSAWSDSSCSADSVLTQTVYKYTNVTYTWSDWSSWSTSPPPAWIFNKNSYETKEDTQVRTRKYDVITTGWNPGTSCTGSDCPRQEDVISSMSYYSTYGEWYQYRGTFWAWPDTYSAWYDVPDSQTVGYSAANTKYRYKILKATTQNKPVSSDFAIEGSVTIGSKPKQTYSDVINQANAMNKADADQQLLALVRNGALASQYNKLGNINILWSEFSSAKSGEYTGYQSAVNHSISGNTWLASESFVPYIYITDHIRANYVNSDIIGYESDSGNMNVSLNELRRENTLKTASGTLVQDDNRSALNTKVIYIDYNTPLKQYAGNLPDNWDESIYNSFMAAIANAKLNDMEGEIRIKMSLEDMQNMREYIKNHPDSLGDCDFLREFSHIFETTSADLSAFLSGSGSCRITDED